MIPIDIRRKAQDLPHLERKEAVLFPGIGKNLFIHIEDEDAVKGEVPGLKDSQDLYPPNRGSLERGGAGQDVSSEKRKVAGRFFKNDLPHQGPREGIEGLNEGFCEGMKEGVKPGRAPAEEEIEKSESILWQNRGHSLKGEEFGMMVLW